MYTHIHTYIHTLPSRWLAEQAEELGVEIYPGFAADEVLYDDLTGAVLGVSEFDSTICRLQIQRAGLSH